MEKAEMIEKLKDKMNITYEEANEALEKNDWDILDAIVYLEKQGVGKKPNISSYTTKEDNNKGTEYNKEEELDFGENLYNTIGDTIEKGNKNVLEVIKQGKKGISIPITILILLFLLAFWAIIPLGIVGLFFDFKYSFKGPDIKGDNILNRYMSNASDFANKIKKDNMKGKEKWLKF